MIIDDRYLPLVISVWRGQANMETAQWHGGQHTEVVQELVGRGQKFVLINDASDAERPPPAVRKYFAEYAEAGSDEEEALGLATIVVLSSPVMRGALTAVGWVSERAARIDTAATMRAALERGLKALDAAGVPRPEGLDPANYTPPEV